MNFWSAAIVALATLALQPAYCAETIVVQSDGAILGLVRREFLTRPVYAADFGELCDGSTDNKAAYTGLRLMPWRRAAGSSSGRAPVL